MKSYEITIYNKAKGKITEIYYKSLSNEHDAISYCRGRCSDKVNAMYEEKKEKRGGLRMEPSLIPESGVTYFTEEN